MKQITSLDEICKISPSALLDKLGITDAPVDVFAIAQNLPITLDSCVYMDDRLDLSGEIKLNNQRKPVIWVNPLEAPNRQRFTMAHEIGHLINDVIPHIDLEGMDDDFRDTIINLKRDGRQDPKEYAANEFAAKLLMPTEFILKNAKDIIKYYKQINGEKAKMPKQQFINDMAANFHVSTQAMEIRLKRVGVI